MHDDLQDPLPSDRLETRLRSHLHDEAASFRTPHDLPTAASVRRSAHERIAARHHRRVAGMSLSGVAAAALVVGLVVNAQAPQPVQTTDLAGPSPLAGVATGSSTGSATGAMKGWRSSGGEAAPQEGIAAFTVALRGTDSGSLTGAWSGGTERGSGRPAADLAVLADVTVGEPVRFVVASPQSSEHLTMGKGGRELTIAGRPARLIVGNHGWHRLIWSMDDETNVLAQAYGLSLDELEQLLTTLGPADGGWAMDPSGTGLEPMRTTPPEAQQELQVMWGEGPEGATSHTTLRLTSGGAYEYWASLVGYTPWHSAELEAVEVGLGDGTTVTAVLFAKSLGASGETWANLVALDPSGTVANVSRFEQGTGEPGSPSAAQLLSDAAPELFVPLDDEAWSQLLRDAVRASERDRPDRSLGVDASGAPATTAPPSAPESRDGSAPTSSTPGNGG